MNLVKLEQESFTQRIADEFIGGSGINPILFSANIRIAADTEWTVAGDASFPIAEALGWRQSRFTQQARENLEAALLLNEDDSTWQAKLSNPRVSKGKPVKYESPVGNGSKPYFPRIPNLIRHKISDRYGVAIPSEAEEPDFWSWVERHTEIPRVWTEGGKKALCLLSQGYLAIALYGVNGGYCSRGDSQKDRSLTSEVSQLAGEGTRHYLAFDQDTKASTRAKVSIAQGRFGGLLAANRTEVFITQWEGSQGKGVDDLIVGQGVGAWEDAYQKALPLVRWGIQRQMDSALTYRPAIQLCVPDLTNELNFNALPDSGIIALASAKGSGKTKAIARMVADSDSALGVLHRITLARNLCKRLNLTYRADLDRVTGRWIGEDGFTQRIGLCVDSLLAINPTMFVGCDLVIDEVCQVLKHLLTSSTCQKDGKRPALLARLEALIKGAQRVIIADADLDNQTIRHIEKLRGDGQPTFLIRNYFQPQGYSVLFVDSSDKSAIIGQLEADIQRLQPGQTILVCTDSKRTSALVASRIESVSGKTALTINSDTSGGEVERNFVQCPDDALSANNWVSVVASPSMSTGVSIEGDTIVKVYGIFDGCSLTDADMAQSLARVRQPVPRVVWVAKTGSNFSKVAPGESNHLKVREALRQGTAGTISLIKASLGISAIAAIEEIEWQKNPHIDFYARLAADQNRSMFDLRERLLVRLKREGHQITEVTWEKNKNIAQTLSATRKQLAEIKAVQTVNATDLTPVEVRVLEQKDCLSPGEQLALAKFYLKEFYVLDQLSEEDVKADNEGRLRRQIAALECQLNPELASDTSKLSIDRQLYYESGIAAWDVSAAALRRQIRHAIGLDKFLAPGKKWHGSDPDVEALAAKAREYRIAIKQHLNFTIKPDMSACQIVNQLLSQMGVKCDRQQRREGGKRISIYSINESRWDWLMQIVERRQERRLMDKSVNDTPVTPPLEIVVKRGGCDTITTERQNPWVTPESLADIRQMWRSAVDSPEIQAEIKQIIPHEALQAAIEGMAA